MTRVCFRLQVDPDRLDEYRRRHTAVWPEMLRELEACGRRNYSLFLGADGLLIGYYETDSAQDSAEYLAASRVAARWEAHMADLFIDVDDRADRAATALDEVFHLDDQLADIRGTGGIAAPDEAAPRNGGGA
ncbi:L-rhamnose mutarotase [Saccharopolyspora sp. HNM0983]|uniref:L-rhamnose mutarotase n=1 Tax=Saccharopolyspora montiporae TaxID=2781240 RepID=A0A929BD26_9PSEU|nr:L-rhamnose mutarotase [Saccharopolyspora sp. HNM0983]